MISHSFSALSSGLAIACALALGPAFGPARAAESVGEVVQVPDGDTLVLSSGDKVRLAGIQAPKLPLGRDFVAWPLADMAREALSGLVLGKQITMRRGEVGKDRHGRILAQVFVEDGVWVQQALVQAGMARVYSLPDNRAGIGDLLGTESMARAERRGLWGDPFYAVRDAMDVDGLAAREGYFEIVEGRVVNAAKSGALVYLNFGRRWSTDFTVVVAPAAQKLFKDAAFDPLSTQDHLVRVRGWIGLNGGPRMEVTHPEQIEVLAAR